MVIEDAVRNTRTGDKADVVVGPVGGMPLMNDMMRQICAPRMGVFSLYQAKNEVVALSDFRIIVTANRTPNAHFEHSICHPAAVSLQGKHAFRKWQRPV